MRTLEGERESWLARVVDAVGRRWRGLRARMSAPATARNGRAQGPGEKPLRPTGAPERSELIGLDVSRPPPRLRRSSTAPLVAAALMGALFLVVLRSEVLRLRYALARAVAEEQALSKEKRRLTVAMRKLRDPARLAREARELGFGPPEQLIELSVTSPPGSAPRRPEPLPEAPRVPATAAPSAGSRP